MSWTEPLLLQFRSTRLQECIINACICRPLLPGGRLSAHNPPTAACLPLPGPLPSSVPDLLGRPLARQSSPHTPCRTTTTLSCTFSKPSFSRSPAPHTNGYPLSPLTHILNPTTTTTTTITPSPPPPPPNQHKPSACLTCVHDGLDLAVLRAVLKHLINIMQRSIKTLTHQQHQHQQQQQQQQHIVGSQSHTNTARCWRLMHQLQRGPVQSQYQVPLE